MNNEHDTIAAIATAPGSAGIGIVRVSGPHALAIADRLFKGPQQPSDAPGGTFHVGHIQTQQHLDKVVLLVYRAPASYTREDVVEFQGHGGHTCMQRLLRSVLQAGARMAEPGEFTRRAFLSGRIDLLQAEAVMDLINAKSERAAHAAMEQLDGSLSHNINSLYDQLMTIAADLESCLDFGEDELPDATRDDILKRLETVNQGFELLSQGWSEGYVLRNGALVVIAGKPNTGKSSLMNALLGKSRAIVTAAPGTTRDTLEETLIINGLPIRLVDTAGIRNADCHIEKEGIRRARNQAQSADVTLIMIDGSDVLDEQDHAIIKNQNPDKTIIVLNKMDKAQVIKKEDVHPFQAIACSVKTGQGLESLKEALIGQLNLSPATSASSHAVISERHYALIQKARHHLQRSILSLTSRVEAYETLAAADTRDALEQLGFITGKIYHNELLNAVFSRFCIGK